MLLRLDGVVQDSDLPVQSFARHLTDGLSAGQGRRLIAGMRGFLEGKPDLIPAGTRLDDAEDGYQAVEMLARGMNLTDGQIRAARRASRVDLASSAWAVEPPEGLDDLLEVLDGRALIAVLTEPGDPAAAALLASIGIAGQVQSVLDEPMGPAVHRLLGAIEASDTPDRLLVMGIAWRAEIEPAAEAGCLTVLLDRYERGRGSPTIRLTGDRPLSDLIDPVRRWLAGQNPSQGTALSAGGADDRSPA